MNNYFTGELKLVIDPKKISKSDLIDMINTHTDEDYNYTISMGIIPNYNILKNKYKIPEEVLYMHQINAGTNSENYYTEFERISLSKLVYLLHPIDGSDPNPEIISQYVVTIEVDCNHYKDNDMEITLIDLLEKFAPYRLEDCGNEIVGEIKDENGSYYREFLWDKPNVRDKKNKKPSMCDGCPFYNDTHPCSFEKKCEDIFNRGYDAGYKEAKSRYT